MAPGVLRVLFQESKMSKLWFSAFILNLQMEKTQRKIRLKNSYQVHIKELIQDRYYYSNEIIQESEVSHRLQDKSHI